MAGKQIFGFKLYTSFMKLLNFLFVCIALLEIFVYFLCYDFLYWNLWISWTKKMQFFFELQNRSMEMFCRLSVIISYQEIKKLNNFSEHLNSFVWRLWKEERVKMSRNFLAEHIYYNFTRRGDRGILKKFLQHTKFWKTHIFSHAQFFYEYILIFAFVYFFQGIVPLEIERLHPDFPRVICDVS